MRSKADIQVHSSSLSLCSMTGFAKAEAIYQNKVAWSVMIRSVNARYLDLRFRIAPGLEFLESELRRRSSQRFRRGSIEVTLIRRVKPESLAADSSEADDKTNLANIDVAKAVRWNQDLQQLALLLGLSSSQSSQTQQTQQPQLLPQHLELLRLITQMPGVLRLPLAPTDKSLLGESGEFGEFLSVAEVEFFWALWEQALSQMEQERRREGEALAHELESILNGLSDLWKRISELREEYNERLSMRLQERWKEFISKSSSVPVSASTSASVSASVSVSALGSISAPTEELVEDARWRQEFLYYLDRADVREELQRIEEHLRFCLELVKNTTSVSEIERKKHVLGKRLDFYAQELAREFNTLGVKSPGPELTKLVVDAKVLIERLREQAQNVE